MKLLWVFFYTALFLMTAGVFFNCNELAQKANHLKVRNRVVTLYAENGVVIKRWEGNFGVEFEDGSAHFKYQGKKVYVSGTFTIEEK